MLQTNDLMEHFLHLTDRGIVPSYVTKGHHDGWGYVAYRKHAIVAHEQRGQSGKTDPLRSELLMKLEHSTPKALLAHIRKASIGLPSERNSHPFVTENFSFIHNGTLGDSRQEIFSHVEEHVDGETDSERYFQLIIRGLLSETLHGDANVVSVIKKTIETIRVGVSFAGKGYSSASAVFCDGITAFIIREFDETHPLVMKHKGENYYTLYIGQSTQDLIVCSEKIPIPNITWDELPNHTLTTISLHDHSRDVYML